MNISPKEYVKRKIERKIRQNAKDVGDAVQVRFPIDEFIWTKTKSLFCLVFPAELSKTRANFRQKGKQFGVLSEQRSFPCLLAFLTVALMSTEAKESQRCHIRPRTEKGMSWMPFKLQSSSEQRRTAYYSQESPMALVS